LDKSGFIEKNEYEILMNEIGPELNVNPSNIDSINNSFSYYDTNKDCKIDPMEFELIVKKYIEKIKD